MFIWNWFFFWFFVYLGCLVYRIGCDLDVFVLIFCYCEFLIDKVFIIDYVIDFLLVFIKIKFIYLVLYIVDCKIGF